MIEISWKDLACTIHHATELLAWLLKEIYETKDDALCHFYMTGYLVCVDVVGNLHTIIMCEGENQKHVLELLKQPPGEFAGKYVACVHEDEHEPVVESTPEIPSDDEEKTDKEIKIEKT